MAYIIRPQLAVFYVLQQLFPVSLRFAGNMLTSATQWLSPAGASDNSAKTRS